MSHYNVGYACLARRPFNLWMCTRLAQILGPFHRKGTYLCSHAHSWTLCVRSREIILLGCLAQQETVISSSQTSASVCSTELRYWNSSFQGLLDSHLVLYSVEAVTPMFDLCAWAELSSIPLIAQEKSNTGYLHTSSSHLYRQAKDAVLLTIKF